MQIITGQTYLSCARNLGSLFDSLSNWSNSDFVTIFFQFWAVQQGRESRPLREGATLLQCPWIFSERSPPRVQLCSWMRNAHLAASQMHEKNQSLECMSRQTSSMCARDTTIFGLFRWYSRERALRSCSVVVKVWVRHVRDHCSYEFHVNNRNANHNGSDIP